MNAMVDVVVNQNLVELSTEETLTVLRDVTHQERIVERPDFDIHEVWLAGERHLLIVGGLTGAAIRIKMPTSS
jgi:hypothetical protein